MPQLVTSIIGLFVLGLFLFFSVQRLAPAIEMDLSHRSSTALAEQGMNWAEVSLDGRELVLSGEAPDADARIAAARTADVWGVRTVDNQLTLAKAAEPSPAVESTAAAQPEPRPEPVRQARLEPTAQACQQELNQLLSARQIEFESGSAEIMEESHLLLQELAEAALKCANTRIEIAGHTDSVGEASINQRLSQDRAKAVLVYLKTAGVPENRMGAEGYGESRPIADNSTEAGRARNRRIEFTIGGQ